MLTVRLSLTHEAYPVYIGENILPDSSVWDRHLNSSKVLIVSNEVVAPLYLERVRSGFSDRQVAVHIIPDGEPGKTLQTWSGILDQLVGMQCRRDATIVALGGGVVGDIAGFAAASYMRGIRFIQVPTTLLAQVDASVGGKTGINHARGKNLIGAFHQPAAVLIDTATLATLEDREFNAGLAEVVKYGMIMDPALFEFLENSFAAVIQRQPQPLSHLIHRSVLDKAEIVSADELETGVRAILNFGHSFGHALEAATAYTQYLHGEAVAIGMVIAARLSEQRGLCPAGETDRMKRLLQHFSLPTALPDQIGAAAMIEALQLDKKAIASGLRLILLSRLGHALVDASSSTQDIVGAIESCR